MRISDWSSDVCSSDLHRLADFDAGHVLADEHHFAGRFVTERRHATGFAVNAAVLDVGEIAAADAAGLDPDDDVRGAGFGPLIGVEPEVIDLVNVEHVTHVAFRSEERRVGKGCVRTRSSWRWP